MFVEVVHTEEGKRVYSVGLKESGFPQMTELRRDERDGVFERMKNGEGVMINDPLRKIYEFDNVDRLGEFRMKQ